MVFADESFRVAGVLIDMGGVLVSQRPNPAQIAHYLGLDQSAHDIEMVDQALWFHRAAYDEGLESGDFWYRVTGDCGIDELTGEQISQLVRLDVERQRTVEPGALEIVHQLKDHGYKVGMVANAPRPIAEAVPTFEWAGDLFDSYTFSSQVGAPKPSRRIFRRALEDIGLEASAVLLIDDGAKNFVKAEAMGMHTLHWETAQQCARALEELGVLPATAPARAS